MAIKTSGELNAMLRAMQTNEQREEFLNGTKYLYFAYGSNMSISQMAIRCPKAKPMFKATLHGAKMLFRTYADVMRFRKNTKSFVRGVVFEITEDCMTALDRYEGYPRMYKKVKCVVQGPYDKYYEAFMYVMQKDVRELKLPSEKYLDTILQGYFDWKIPTTSLCKAWEETALQLGEIKSFNSKESNND